MFGPSVVAVALLATLLLIALEVFLKRQSVVPSLLGMGLAAFLSIAGAVGTYDNEQWAELGERWISAKENALDPEEKHVNPVIHRKPGQGWSTMGIFFAFPLFLSGFAVLTLIAWYFRWRLAAKGY